jgi:hypothetical protein
MIDRNNLHNLLKEIQTKLQLDPEETTFCLALMNMAIAAYDQRLNANKLETTAFLQFENV